MNEKAILAIEEALLSSLFTIRALVELLIKKDIIRRSELEKELLQTETETVGAGSKHQKMFLNKREKPDRRGRMSRKKNPERRIKKRRD